VSVFFTIDKDELLSALKDFPLHLKYLKAVGKQRLKTTNPEDLLDEDGNDMGVRLQHEINAMKKNQGAGDIIGVDSPHRLGETDGNHNDLDHSALDELYGYYPKWYLTEQFKYVSHFVIIPFSK
jgi:hypothetical protein